MKKILVAGAGKSSICLIQCLLKKAAKYKWTILVADTNLNAIKEKIGHSRYGEAVVLDIHNETQRKALVADVDFVVSILPPDLHILLAKDCLEFRKNLITSSYISPEMKAMHEDVKKAGLTFMCEMGLDPGIDHMSANKILDGIKRISGDVVSFKSYCGGLVAPENDTNSWHYKISWNPRNVVLAGKDGAVYLEDGKEQRITYDKMFANSGSVDILGMGKCAFYPNRDSLKYIETYNVEGIHTFIRATLRHTDFCIGWDAVVQLGLTDTNDIKDRTQQTFVQWIAEKNKWDLNKKPVTDYLKAKFTSNTELIIKLLSELGLLDEIFIYRERMSSADILQKQIEERWNMEAFDKDMVIMQHNVTYVRDEKPIELVSTMVIKGDNREYSAMAKTVGLPMAILTILMLTNAVNAPHGVLIPNMACVYRPVLNALRHEGIDFYEEVK